MRNRASVCVAVCFLAHLLPVSCFVPKSFLNQPLGANPLDLLFVKSVSPIFSTTSNSPSQSGTPATDDTRGNLNTSHERLALLDDALRFNSSSTAVLLDELNGMRKDNAPQEDIERFLNDLLESVDGPAGIQSENGGTATLPFWTKFRQLARFSRRARLASLRRVLDISTPSSDEKESLGDDPDADQRQRRRSLIVLIRALANTESDDEEEGDAATSNKVSGRRWRPAISVLESAARKDLRASFKVEDMENRLPPGLETPEYTVLARRKGYEIRSYEPFSVCFVSMKKPRPPDSSKTDAKISSPQLAGASSFGALAGYLFGKNEESTAMKMTTPVISEGEGDDKKMAFVLPSEFWKDDGLESAPKPLQGSGVQLERKDGGERAAIMFGGFASKKDVEQKKVELLSNLAKDSEWIVEKGETATLAQYNDPFTPPWRRRNEVSIRVGRKNNGIEL